MMMQKNVFVLVFALACLGSCSTKVDLYADFKDTTIVYGVLNNVQDTNFVKITRAFSGSDNASFDVFQITQIADSLNYPGKLNARFIELKNGQDNSFVPTGREIVLDTITLHNKQEGLFYAPYQKMYYTTERFKVNSGNNKYRYRLAICKSNDTVTSEIGLLGGSNFQIRTTMVKFKSEASANTGKVYFTPDENAGVYKIDMQFKYKELRPGQDTVKKTAVWTLGTFLHVDLGYENGSNYVTYPENSLFTVLNNVFGDDTLKVERFYDSFVISMDAYGRELYDYTLTNGASGSLIDYTYTNIKGGFGVLSSRCSIERKVDISSRTKTDLMASPWGFKYIGYKE